MPADPDLQLRTAGTWDTTGVIDTMAPVLARTDLLWSLHPPAGTHTTITREHLRHLSCRPGNVRLRLAERDGQILAAAWWTTCTTTHHPPAELSVPAADRLRSAALLHTQLAAHHPPEPHDHLLLIAARTGHHRTGLGTALLTDPDLSGTPRPRYLVLPTAHTPTAARAGYRNTGRSIPVTTTVHLHPWWQPTPVPAPTPGGNPVRSR
jgi:hypothetical protein